MKIAVFTYNRYETLTTPEALRKAGAVYDVVCHTPEARAGFVAGGRVDAKRLLVSGAAKGLANNRNWYLETQVKAGEWVLMLCDDFLRVTEFDEYETWRETFLPVDTTTSTRWSQRLRRALPMRGFLARCEELAAELDRRGLCLGGFAGYDNPLFRRHKWKLNVLADGRALLVKKTHLRFDTNAQMVDDVAFSALNIEQAGGVLVNQWVLPYFSRYTKGSFGSISERLVQRRAECGYLVQRFPGLVKVGKKPGWPSGTHVRIRWMAPARLKAWREATKFLRKGSFFRSSDYF